MLLLMLLGNFLHKITLNCRQTWLSTVAIGKAQAAYAQSFTWWQQTTIEFTWHDHSIIPCSRHIYVLLFFVHIPFMMNHTINTTPTERLQQHPLYFITKRTDRAFFLWRLHLAQPLHPGHSTILLRSESPSGMCAKLQTVTASKIEITRHNHSIIACSHHIYGVVLCTHPVHGESHIQCNTNREVATLPAPLSLNFFFEAPDYLQVSLNFSFFCTHRHKSDSSILNFPVSW